MKKIIIAMAAIAAAFTMVSCNKELVESENNPTEGDCILTASTESSLTKTSLDGNDTDGYEVVWSDGDTFKIGDNTFTLIERANTTTGKFQGTLPEGDGPFYAYYPAEYNGTDWPTTQVYTAGNITGSPMKAEVVKGAESLGFKNEGGILRLTLKGNEKIKSVKVFMPNSDGITLNCGDGVDLDNTDGKVFHIAMPVGTYNGTTIQFISSDDRCCIKTLKSGKPLVINRSEITSAAIKVDNFKYYPIDGALSETFTVADDGNGNVKKVFFAKGNLWRGYDELFHFEESQYDFNKELYDPRHISHFMWSKDVDVACALQYNDLSATENVFFTNANGVTPNSNFTVNGQKGVWRTLSADEWTYLVDHNGSLWTTIDGVNGRIIFCDGYSGSRTGLTEIPNGCLFLPAAGFRNGGSGSTRVDAAGSDGFYWSASSFGDYAYGLNFFSDVVDPSHSDRRSQACAVRLVTECQSEPSAE